MGGVLRNGYSAAPPFFLTPTEKCTCRSAQKKRGGVLLSEEGGGVTSGAGLPRRRESVSLNPSTHRLFAPHAFRGASPRRPNPCPTWGRPRDRMRGSRRRVRVSCRLAEPTLHVRGIIPIGHADQGDRRISQVPNSTLSCHSCLMNRSLALLVYSTHVSRPKRALSAPAR